MKASSLETGLTVIGRMCGLRSSASGTSFATSTRPSERSKTTPPSGIAGRSQTKSTGGSTLSRGLPAHGLGGDQGRVEARGNAIIVIITKQASGTANIDRLMLAFNTIALASHSSEPCKFQDLGRVHS